MATKLQETVDERGETVAPTEDGSAGVQGSARDHKVNEVIIKGTIQLQLPPPNGRRYGKELAHVAPNVGVLRKDVPDVPIAVRLPASDLPDEHGRRRIGKVQLPHP